ncbi:TonB-linked outer membrane protein, SusC/RagA family [Pedobacter westerhofensis]|uniref:TonB-linked outer membrane protein, SusC/RagA family n=1 Tax=Pedobacter westerhofensis TaxID=425512 RepID=A0A521BQU5_9SPHI|nr:TonB-dependent receptor [Pedobacter westerhofensis]SMO48920.1 TonB-linked outer membrane protein, SusC/RagA family [Pedobacter westerhofensis]
MNKKFTNLKHSYESFVSQGLQCSRAYFIAKLSTMILLVSIGATQAAVTNIPQPPRTITGKITDETGGPLPGVSIKLKGTTAAAITNNNGSFSIQIPESTQDGILVFSFVGYKVQELPIPASSVLNVKMVPDSKNLNELVVIGYGTQKRGDISSAISSVNKEKMDKIPTANLSTALQGQAPGVVATPGNFKPGSGASIRIRGSRSLSATNDPLFVVDGVPVSYSIDDINPLDIESIDILKDASATAIYGSRGANGVIQIVTKKGKAGKVTIDYSASTSVEEILRKLDVFDGPEYAQFKRDAYIGGKAYNTGLSNTSTAQRYFPDAATDYKLFSADANMLSKVLAGYTFTKYDPANNIFDVLTRPTTAEEKTLLTSLGYPVLDNVAVYDPSKVSTFDWQKEGLRKGTTQSHNLSVTAGSEKFSDAFSLGYFNQKGIIPGQDYTRYSVSNSASFRPAAFLNIGGNLTYTNAIQNAGTDVYGGASFQLPLAQPYDANGTFILNPGNDANIINPLNDENSMLNERKISHFLGNVFASLNLYKGLNFKSTFGADVYDSRNGIFNGSISSSRQGNPASASYATNSNLSWTLQNQLSYALKLGQKHDISIIAVQELVKNRSDTTNASATGLSYESQKWYSLQNNVTGVVTYAGSFSQNQLASFLGRVTYSYNGRYVLTIAERYDGSSVLSAENQGKSFPSGSVAWRLDQEDFIKKFTFIDQLKLRGGVGAVGNSGIRPYLTNGTLGITYYNFGSTPAKGYAPNGLPLPQLAWEKTVTKNLGLDFSVFKGKVTGSVDVYESNTNVIQPQKLPDASGYSNITVNLGEVRNRGVEIALSTENYNKNGFKWTTDFVFSKNKEAITKLDGSGNNNITSGWFIGQPVRSYYDYQAQGIFQNSDAQPGGILYEYYWKKAGNRTNTALQPGRIRVQDTNADTVITEADKVVLGSPNPDWTGSINTTFSYKGFELSAFLYISHGGLVRDPRPSLVGRFQYLDVNYWTPTNPSNEYPQPNLTSDIPLYWQASGFRDASFARIRSILLSYRLPASFLEKIKLRNLTISLNALNPFLFSKYKTYDPETVAYLSSYPSSSTNTPVPTSYSYRSLVFGLKAGF